MGQSSLWSISCSHHQMFYPYAILCHPGPWKWRSTSHDVAIFSPSFFFFGRAKNLGICEATKDRSSVSSKKREKKEPLWAAFGGAFGLEQPSCGVVMSLAAEGCRPLRHSSCLVCTPLWDCACKSHCDRVLVTFLKVLMYKRTQHFTTIVYI